MGKLEGKIALVTGGNGGIGLATAKRFVSEGAYVFITGRRTEELAAAVKEIGQERNRSAGRRVEARRSGSPVCANQAREGQARYCVRECRRGEICAARLDHRGVVRFDLQYQREGTAFHRAEGASAAAGRSVHYSECVRSSGAKDSPTNSVYSATKAAVRSFARTWTTDLKDRRIRVNAVSPGSTDTPGARDLLASSEVGEQRKKMIATVTPLGRFGTPDEIAKAVVFLACDDSSYVTGIELFVDGGFAQV